MILFQLIVLLVAAMLLGIGPRWGKLPQPGRAGFRALARRPAVVIALTGLVGGATPALLATVQRWPVPEVHDEFSYLLAGDTFAHGRLANPTPPQWEHFESFHILLQPTYASKYPPAQGLFLAIGQVLTGIPLVGVWLSVGLCAAALSWGLFGWLPPRWATALSPLVAWHPLVTEWGLSYWGGAVACLGAALIYGALPRLTVAATSRRRVGRHPLWAAAWMGLGAVLLANSRPFEGLLVCLPVGVCLAVSLLRARGVETWPRRVSRLWTANWPAVAVLACGLGGMLYYNQQVTGSALRHPHRLHYQRYCISPIFLWQAPNHPEPYRHEMVRNFHEVRTLGFYQQAAERSAVLQSLWTRPLRLEMRYFGLSAAILVVTLPGLARRRGHACLFAAVGVCVAAYLAETFAQVHYLAPMLPATLVLLGSGLRLLFHSRRSSRAGDSGDASHAASRGRAGEWSAALIAGALVVAALGQWFERPPQKPWAAARDELSRRLAARGRHLVIVRYADRHDPHDEWVYNDADLAGSPVIWAREMSSESDQALIAAFPGRRVWLLRPDDPEHRFAPYPGSSEDTGNPWSGAAAEERPTS